MLWSNECFYNKYRFDGLVDIGRKRKSNQDVIICVPECGFFAVSDGMGGLACGGETSDLIRQVLPGFIKGIYEEIMEEYDDYSADKAKDILVNQIVNIGDNIYESGNEGGNYIFGSTLSGVWLFKDKAIFINIGDSRGYKLIRYKRQIKQVSIDHNLAEIMIQNGELSKSQAKNHPASSRLTRFIGMDKPTRVEGFVVDINKGDRILLCSDGLYGMVDEKDMRRIMRSSKSPNRICKRLINEANSNGGRDNISCVYVKIEGAV